MTDTRRVCDLSAAELHEAAVAASSPLGVTRGRWEITLQLEDGHLVRAEHRPGGQMTFHAHIGRRALHQLRGDQAA